jgi:hypothetical protein
MSSHRSATIVFSVFCLSCALPTTSASADASFRVSSLLTGAKLDEDDVFARLGADHPIDLDLDGRFMISRTAGAWTGTWHHVLSLRNGDSIGPSRTLGTALDQNTLKSRSGTDAARLVDLASQLDQGSRHALRQGVDRLNLRYQSESWNVVIGREAVSFGGGLVFHPMDLLNPFSPAAVDKDFKPGEDLVQIQRRLGADGEVSLLGVGRRDAAGDPTFEASSLALHFRGMAGSLEIELLSGRHFQDEVLGAGIRWPIGGSLIRTDLVVTRLDHDRQTLVSGLVNVDYSFTTADQPMHVFAEFYHSGFGVRDLAPGAPLPTALSDRLERGEVHVLMRDYLVLGGSISWHPLVTQTLVVVNNLQDASSFLQSTLSFDLGSTQQLDVGLLVQTGAKGDEFGGRPVAMDTEGKLLSVGSGDRIYLRWTWYP